jgi:hypothetical protein
MRRPQVGKFGEQICPTLSLCYLPICEGCQKDVHGVVGERPATVGEGRLARAVIMEDLWQHRLCHPHCFLRRISTRVLKRVREGGDETCVGCRFLGDLGISLCVGDPALACPSGLRFLNTAQRCGLRPAS